MGYAVVLGEALIDLLETERDGELIYRQAIGGAPLNVSVGTTRLGGDVQYVGSLSNDILGDRIAQFLRSAGVGIRGVKRVPVPTTLAVTTFEGAELSTGDSMGVTSCVLPASTLALIRLLIASAK